MGYRYKIIGDYTDQPTVYKILIGKKFYIWKGKMLKQSAETMAADIDRLLRKGIPGGHLLTNVIQYITKARPLELKIEVLLQTDNLAELLDFENFLLKQNISNPECLNFAFTGHVPKWMTENKAITDTFAPSEDYRHPPVVDNAATAPDISTNRKSGLMDALAKLKTD